MRAQMCSQTGKEHSSVIRKPSRLAVDVGRDKRLPASTQKICVQRQMAFFLELNSSHVKYLLLSTTGCYWIELVRHLCLTMVILIV